VIQLIGYTVTGLPLAVLCQQKRRLKILKRLFLWVFIVFATIYPPAELTLAILNQEFELRLHPEIPLYYFQMEMITYWLLYIGAMFIILAILLVEAQIARQNNHQQQ
jgi:hypothetical protein